MKDITVVEDIVRVDIFLYDLDLVDGSVIGELARRSVGKHSNTLRLLRYNSHICHVSNSNALFKGYRCPSCDQSIEKVQHLERLLTTCKERVKHVISKDCFNCEKHFLAN